MGFGYSSTVAALLFVLFYGTATEVKDNSNGVSWTEDNNQDINLYQNEIKIITVHEKELNVNYFYNITSQWAYIIIQTHSQYRNLSLLTKYNKESYTSANAAIFKSISYDGNPFDNADNSHDLGYVLQPSKGSSYQSLITIVTITGKSPIPGGCCLTCNLLVDPNLVIHSQQYYKTIVSFSLANVYDYKTSFCSGKPHEKPHHYRLQYSVYQYFLEEGNLGDDELFSGLAKMLTPTSVKQHGKKVRVWHPEKDKPILSFDTTRGQGIIFNILVHDPLTNTEAVYSPLVTYGCSFTAKVDGCDSLGSVINIVLAVFGGLVGLLICLFGYRLYHLYILLCASTLFSFFGFIVLTNRTEWNHNVRIIGSLSIGVVGGCMVYFCWRLTQYRHIVLYICGLTFGFLIAAVLFFTPFGNLRYWKNDVNYWTVMFCISFTVPFVFLLFLKTFVILVSSVVGAYGVVVGIDTFLHSSLSYILLDVLVKAIEDDFQKYDVPFQEKDFILSAVWVFLTILGAFVQYNVSKGQTTLHPMPSKDKEKTRNRPASRHPRAERQQDRDPLLPHVVNNDYNDDSEDDEQLPILVQSRTVGLDVNNQRNTRYGTNIVC